TTATVRNPPPTWSEHCLRLSAQPWIGKRLLVQRSSSWPEVTANSPARKENGGVILGSSPKRTISARLLLVMWTSDLDSLATRCSQKDSLSKSPSTLAFLSFKVRKARKEP